MTITVTRVGRLLGALAVMALVAATGGDVGAEASPNTDSNPQAPAPTSGGTLVWAVGQEIPGWSPLDVRATTAGQDRAALIYDTLLLLTPDGDWEPNTADMETDDGTTWTMTLRDGVTFTDGTPLDAEAVKFNVELAMDPEGGSSLIGLLSTIEAVTVIDALTLEFTLSTVNGSFPHAFATLPGMMMSPTAYEADPDGFSERPVGAGPFMLESWVRDSTAMLVRNPDYWDEGKPYLEAIEVRVLLDSVTRGQALLSGDIDLAQTDAVVLGDILRSDDLEDFTTGANGGQALSPNLDREPFDDIRIRQAIALAWDNSVINETLVSGGWPDERLNCPPFTPGVAECVENIWPEPDPERARDLVERYEQEVGPLEGGYEVVAPQIAVSAIDLVQQQLGAIGIDVQATILPTPEWAERRLSGDYDLLWSADPPFVGPGTLFYPKLHSEEWFQHKGTPDPELDAAIEEAGFALDPDVRADAARRVQEYVVEHMVLIWFAPYISGLGGDPDVVLGDRYWGGPVLVGQDVWLDR